MHILLSNDDGYLAPGLRTLYAKLKTLPEVSKITVIAPERNRSAASNSLTLQTPLRVFKDQLDDNILFVNGTPADCVHLALTGYVETPVDLVLSGINEGANMGDDVIYSGTVAAAMEGRFMGLPAIAVSLTGYVHYETAAEVTASLLQKLFVKPLAKDTLLNVNVPDIPYEELQGIEVVRLGSRHKATKMVPMKDPRGRDVYWVGPAGVGADISDDTDFYSIERNKATVTPLTVDLTNYEQLHRVKDWLGE